jgi:cytochrome c2
MNQMKYVVSAGLILMLLFATIILSTKIFNYKDQEQETVSILTEDNSSAKFAPVGRRLFQQNCQSCHKIVGYSPTAPPLAGVLERGPWSDRTKLYAWVRNPSTFKDRYTKALKKEYGYVMIAFPDLTDEQIDAIISYCSLPPASVLYGVAYIE